MTKIETLELTMPDGEVFSLDTSDKADKASVDSKNNEQDIAINAAQTKADSAYALADSATTPAEVDAKIAALVDSSPTTLNTLNELAAALGDDPNFATTISTKIGTAQAKADSAYNLAETKADLVNGKVPASQLPDDIGGNTDWTDITNKPSRLGTNGDGTGAGDNSTLFGSGNTASKQDSVAIGTGNISSDLSSTALGQQNEASGLQSSAVGYGNTATASEAIAVGYMNQATGVKSTAIGYSNTVSGSNSNAFGRCVRNSTSNSTEVGYSSSTSSPQYKTRVSEAGFKYIHADEVVLEVTDAIALFKGDVTGFYSSDERIKSNIKPIDSALDTISKLRTVSYNKQVNPNLETPDTNTKYELGLIAQDVQAVLPHLVTEDDDGILRIKSGSNDLLAVAFAAIKELQAEVALLRNKVG